MLTEDDVQWLSWLCHKRYNRIYDAHTTEQWFRNIVLKQPVMFNPVRLDNAFCISMLNILPWLPGETECCVVFICADEGFMWEAFRLLRASIEWGRMRKCSSWKLSSDTGYDLKQMAYRLGAHEQQPRYVLRY